jgi:hypothetical protein
MRTINIETRNLTLVLYTPEENHSIKSLVIEAPEDCVGLLRVSFFEGVRGVYVGAICTYKKDSHLMRSMKPRGYL